MGHGQPPYLVEQVDCSSEGQDQVDWLPVTVRQVCGHLEGMGVGVGILVVQGLELQLLATSTSMAHTYLTIPLHVFHVGLQGKRLCKSTLSLLGAP